MGLQHAAANCELASGGLTGRARKCGRKTQQARLEAIVLGHFRICEAVASSGSPAAR